MINYKYKTKPYAHQSEALYKLYGKTFGALFMEQGTGKSKTIIDIAGNIFNEGKINAVLLIAPNTVHTQWAKEQIPEHSPVPSIIFNWKSANTKIYKKNLEHFTTNMQNNVLKWFCVNVEAFSTDNNIHIFRNFLYTHKAMVIVDEATTIKNPSAKRSFNITYNLGRVIKKGKRIVASMPYSKYRFILTGTMVTNSPYDLWSMFEFLSQDYFQMNYWGFKNRYGIERTDTVSNSPIKYTRPISIKEIQWARNLLAQNCEKDYICNELGITEKNLDYIQNNPNLNVPYKNLSELKQKIDSYSYIVRKKDCLDLPEKIYEILPVELSIQQRKIYKDLEKTLFAEYEKKELTVVNKLSLLMRLSQVTGGFFPYEYTINGEEDIIIEKGIASITSNAKIEVLKRDLEETDEKVIIFAHFTAEVELIIKELTKKFPEKRIEGYYGKTSSTKRAHIKEDFKAGLIDILVGNPACAGVGLNLQKAHLVYYYSNSHSLYYRAQSEDRVHRIGQNETVVYKDIIAVNTIDEKIMRSIRQKKNLLEYFRDHSIKEFIIEY